MTAVREALLLLHRMLLESEHASYERIFGKVGSSYQFLQLVTTDPWFAWLHPVTQLIVTMDEALEAKEALTAAHADALMGQVKSLLVPTLDGRGFSRHYDEALQRDPDVVFAHAATARLIRAGD
jgi:hypothetical protein